jgi:hypothetical protein
VYKAPGVAFWPYARCPDEEMEVEAGMPRMAALAAQRQTVRSASSAELKDDPLNPSVFSVQSFFNDLH